jgi:four helix bundle protein
VTGQMPWLTMLTLVTTWANKQAWCLSLLQEFEKKGLCDQLQRAAVSISSNIAEGAARTSDAEFARFLDIALGSAFEVETQLKIANNVGYFDNLDANLDIDYQKLMDRIHSIERQLNGLISSIRKS